MPYNSITIANYFIKKYGENGNLTPLKLIKLSYIAYGWYLALTEGEKLIDNNEQVEAWAMGPVFPDLYHSLKHYGKQSVKEPIDIKTDDEISDSDSKFLDKIWNVYGKRDGIYLTTITHTPDTPWSITYPKGYNLEIPDNLILEHYKGKMKTEVVAG